VDEELTYRIKLKLTKCDDRIEIDLSGTSKQAPTSINCGFLDTKTGHVTVRHPVIVANLLATMQEFTGGRALPVLATGNSAARGVGLPPARVDELAEAVAVIRSYWRGEGGRYRGSVIPQTGIRREPTPIFVAADGPRTMEMAGEVGDGALYGGTLGPSVLGRRIAAARRRSRLEFWVGPAATLAETTEDAGAELGALLVAVANRALRGDLGERDVPPDTQEAVRAMWQRYDYGFHADTTRPRNSAAVDSSACGVRKAGGATGCSSSRGRCRRGDVRPRPFRRLERAAGGRTAGGAGSARPRGSHAGG
jgi:hypothetical protein